MTHGFYRMDGFPVLKTLIPPSKELVSDFIDAIFRNLNYRTASCPLFFPMLEPQTCRRTQKR